MSENEPMMYFFHGLTLTKGDYEWMKAEKDNGRCPICDVAYSRQYRALDRHITACIKRNSPPNVVKGE